MYCVGYSHDIYNKQIKTKSSADEIYNKSLKYKKRQNYKKKRKVK